MPNTSRVQLPEYQLLVLAFCRFCQPFAIASTFAFFPEYVEYLGVSSDKVPLWVGVLAATFNIGECLSAFPCAYLADKFGRKPVLITTLGLAMFSNLAIGFCTNLYQAFVCIAFAGLMNGNVAVMRTSVAEMVPSQDLQAKAFAFLPTAAGLGTILGPIVGGSLAHASERYPSLFGKMSILSTHPFAMPAMIAMAIFLVAFLTALVSLQESRRQYELIANHATDYIEDDDEAEDAIDLAKISQQGLRNGTSTLEGEDVKSGGRDWPNKFLHISNVNIWINAVCGLHSIAFDHMLPVFLHHSNNRSQYHSLVRFAFGLGKDSRFIGTLLTLAGIFGMTITIFAVPRLVKSFGNKGVLRISSWLFPLIYLLFPWSALPKSQVLRILTLAVLVLVKVAISVSALQSCLILITNSVTSHELASAHGVNFALASVARGIGSFSSGLLFSYGISNNLIALPFWVLATWALLNLVLVRLNGS